MAAKSQRSKGQDGVLPSPNMVIDSLNLTNQATGMAQAKTAFDSASDLFTIIGVSLLVQVLAWSTKWAASN